MEDSDYLENFHYDNDCECEECKSIDESYPRTCSCGGLIHCYEYWYDDIDSEDREICDKCKFVTKHDKR
jgi:hypothetical protein